MSENKMEDLEERNQAELDFVVSHTPNSTQVE